MGVFNGSCFVTNLTIEPGDPVVGFVLFNGVKDLVMDAPDLWRPCGGIVLGKYNWYGGVEPEGHELYHSWLFDEWNIAFEKGVFQCGEYIKPESLEDLITQLPREDSCGISDARQGEGRPTETNVALCHRWAFDLIANSITLTKSDSMLVGWMRRIKHDAIHLDYAEQLINACEKGDPLPPKPNVPSPDEDAGHFFARMLSPQAAELKDWWGAGLTGRLFDEDVDEDRLPAMPDENLRAALSEVYRLQYAFHIGIGRTETLIYHPSRTGHQETDWEWHEKIAQGCLDWIRQKQAKQDKEE